MCLNFFTNRRIWKLNMNLIRNKTSLQYLLIWTDWSLSMSSSIRSTISYVLLWTIGVGISFMLVIEGFILSTSPATLCLQTCILLWTRTVKWISTQWHWKEPPHKFLSGACYFSARIKWTLYIDTIEDEPSTIPNKVNKRKNARGNISAEEAGRREK